MMKMNKIIGILLAVCFLLSVTAAAVSAADPQMGKEGQKGKFFGDKNREKTTNNFDKYRGDDGRHKKKVCYWVKGHVDKKVIKIYRGHHFVGYKVIKRWVPGHKVCFYVRGGHDYRSR